MNKLFSSQVIQTNSLTKYGIINFSRYIASTSMTQTTNEIQQQIPTTTQKSKADMDALESTTESLMNKLDQLPLAKWADFLGEKFCPKLESIKEETDKDKRMQKYTTINEPPEIPHFLPLTKWLSTSKNVRETLIVDDQKRKKARLSWYHPDDTLVPRDWFKKGLLEDIKYYKPFSKED